MLARYEEDLADLGGLQDLIHGVEFLRLGKMADVAGVDQERGRRWQRIDARHGFLQRSDDVLIGRLVEADMAVADLHEAEAVVRGGVMCFLAEGHAAFQAHKTPVPAQAMHSRKPRRSMPSWLRSFSAIVLVISLCSNCPYRPTPKVIPIVSRSAV